MKYRIYLIISIFFSNLLSVHASTLQQDIDQLIEQNFPQATIGVFIKEAESGRVLYQHNANKLLSPASNIKMLTAAAALYHLGPNDHYTTSLAKDNKNIYITFSGSPDLSSENLKQLLSHLKQNTPVIMGNVILDTSQFKPPYHPAGSSYDDLGWYYEAPSTAIILDGNEEAYDFISAKTLNKPMTLKPKKTNPILHILNNVLTVSKEQAKDHCSLNIEPQPNNTLRLYGCFAQTEQPQKMQFAIPEPAAYAKQLIKTALKEHHILLKGQIMEGKTPSQANVIASQQSAALSKLLTHMLEESDNLYADSITKRLAYSVTKEGTYKQGAFAIKQILAKHTHLDMNQVTLADGDGTRYNLISPKQIVIFLTDLYQDKKMKSIFLNALPRMGISGTLKERMKKTSLENSVSAKTGSMHDISALSGYLQLPNNKTIIFSIVSNNVTGVYSKAKELEDKILQAVYSQQVGRNRPTKI